MQCAVVRVISCLRFREAQQSFSGVACAVAFVEEAERLERGGKDYEFVKRLAHSANGVHIFSTTALGADPVSTFHLASLLTLAEFPRTLQRFKTAYVRSTGYGLNERMAWGEQATTELLPLLDIQNYDRTAGSVSNAH